MQPAMAVKDCSAACACQALLAPARCGSSEITSVISVSCHPLELHLAVLVPLCFLESWQHMHVTPRAALCETWPHGNVVDRSIQPGGEAATGMRESVKVTPWSLVRLVCLH